MTDIIAIVDDDSSMRESLTSLLRSHGFTVRAFASAEEFLRSGRASETRCLLLDLRMPGISGFEVQERLAGERRRTPIIFLTAHGDEQARARALEAGAVEFLAKPFSEHALLDAVRAALGGPAA